MKAVAWLPLWKRALGFGVCGSVIGCARIWRWTSAARKKAGFRRPLLGFVDVSCGAECRLGGVDVGSELDRVWRAL